MLDRFKHVPLYIQLKDELIDNIKMKTGRLTHRYLQKKALWKNIISAGLL